MVLIYDKTSPIYKRSQKYLTLSSMVSIPRPNMAQQACLCVRNNFTKFYLVSPINAFGAKE